MQENSVGDDWNVCLVNDISIRNIPRLTSVKLAAYSHSAADSTKKVKVKTPPKKLESPTTHVTETSFFHVLYPPAHFGTIYMIEK